MLALCRLSGFGHCTIRRITSTWSLFHLQNNSGAEIYIGDGQADHMQEGDEDEWRCHNEGTLIRVLQQSPVYPGI